MPSCVAAGESVTDEVAFACEVGRHDAVGDAQVNTQAGGDLGGADDFAAQVLDCILRFAGGWQEDGTPKQGEEAAAEQQAQYSQHQCTSTRLVPQIF